MYIADPVLWNNYWLYEKKCGLLDDWLIYIDIKEKAVITKLEFHVCDHCNLNCKGCSHLAPIYKELFADIDQFERDVQRLSELFATILRFRLMGGEPFLDSKLGKFVEVARAYFPNTHLEIVTNGLLLSQVSDEIWDTIRDNDAFLNISLYPPTYKHKREIEEYLDKKKIGYSFGSGLEQYNETGIIEEFHKNLTVTANHSPWEASSRCMGSRCLLGSYCS